MGVQKRKAQCFWPKKPFSYWPNKAKSELVFGEWRTDIMKDWALYPLNASKASFRTRESILNIIMNTLLLSGPSTARSPRNAQMLCSFGYNTLWLQIFTAYKSNSNNSESNENSHGNAQLLSLVWLFTV